MSQREIIDYSESFPEAVAAHGKDTNILVLSKLDKPFKRFDGKTATYIIQYRALSTQCVKQSDEAWARVLFSDVTYWQAKEFDLASIKAKTKTLFDEFNCF